MALKDLAADLKNFKYGISSPDRLDGQIENGVDFFDNNEGGADGFTPKTDLESLYHKVRDGNVVAGPTPPGNTPQFTDDFMTTPIADYFSSFNPPENTSLTFSVNQHTSTGPTQFQIRDFDDTPSVPEAHLVSNDNGKWGGYNLPGPNSTAGQSRMITINDKRRGVFDHLPNLLFESQPFPQSQNPNSVFAPTYSRFFNEISSKTIMRMVDTEILPGVVVQIPEYETIVGARSIHISPDGELKTGLRYGIESNGIFAQLGSGITINDTKGVKWPDNAPTNAITDRYSTLNYPYPLSEGSRLHNWGDNFEEKWPDAAKSYDKERGGYDQYPHLNTETFSSDPLNFPLSENGLFNEIKTPGASVHVSNLGQIKAGYLYGAFDSALTDFNVFTQTSDGLIDIFSTPGSQNYSGPASLYGIDISGLTENSPTSAKRVVPISVRMGLARPLTQLELQQIASLEQKLEDAYQQQSDQDRFEDATQNPEPIIPSINELESQIAAIQGREVKADNFFGGSQMFNILPIQSNAIANSNFNEGYNKSDYLSDRNLGPFQWGSDFSPEGLESLSGVQYKLLGFIKQDSPIIYRRKGLFDSTAVPWKRIDGEIPNDSERYGGGKNFPKVPSGLDINNKFGTDEYRKVANKGPFEGKDNQPFILREIGNNWGFDNIPLDDNPISDAISGMVRGAPGITGLISRNVTDKLRLGKFLFFTSEGLAFNLKQFGLQALNPTLESKIYNPLSVLGMAGAGDAVSGVFDAFKGAFTSARNKQFPSIKEFANTVKSGISGDFLASLLLPIGHPERHLGGLKYEDVNPLTAISEDSDLGKKIKSIPFIGGKVFDEINKKIGDLGGFSRLQSISQNIDMGGDMFSMIGGDFGEPDGITRMTLINPNRYLFPISSAPVTIERGVPSFLSGPDVAKRDAEKIANKKGGTFNTDLKIRGHLSKHSKNFSFGGVPYVGIGDDRYENQVKLTDTAKLSTIYFDSDGFESGNKKIELSDASPILYQLPSVGITGEIDTVTILDAETIIMDPNFFGRDIPLGKKVQTFRSNIDLKQKPGSVFNYATSVEFSGTATGHGINVRYNTLAYDNIPDKESIEANNANFYEEGGHGMLTNKGIVDGWDLDDPKDFKESQKIVRHLGETYGGRKSDPNFLISAEGNEAKFGKINGKIKGDANGNGEGSNVDKLNITPLLHHEGEGLPDRIKNNPDFIKFMFKDVVNNKYLVFRAIVDGITDSITPDFAEHKFIGRPDKVYTYQGTDRNVTFNFKIYPKTKQELPVLMEKLNYLIGLCYPSFTPGERMITPFIELTLGDMFNKTPGLLSSLSATVEDATTWEIDEGLQYPHFISCACEFKYIGGENNVPTSYGKHYDLSWLRTNQNGETVIGDDVARDKYTFINELTQ